MHSSRTPRALSSLNVHALAPEHSSKRSTESPDSRTLPGLFPRIPRQGTDLPLPLPHQFKRFYVCLDACRRGFLAGCRGIIGLDGCFLKGPCKGELLSAIGKDANNQMYPIAWAVVEAECTDSWTWFLNNLKHDLGLGNGNGWSFMSDRQKISDHLTSIEIGRLGKESRVLRSYHPTSDPTTLLAKAGVVDVATTTFISSPLGLSSSQILGFLIRISKRFLHNSRALLSSQFTRYLTVINRSLCAESDRWAASGWPEPESWKSMEGLVRCSANHALLSPISFLERSAKVHRDRTSLVYGPVEYTWGETHALCVRLASALAQLGISRGDVVATLASNVPTMYELHFAVSMAGAVLCTLNARHDPAMVSVLLRHSGAKLIFVDYEFANPRTPQVPRPVEAMHSFNFSKVTTLVNMSAGFSRPRIFISCKAFFSKRCRM
ncbi:hypothetical protein CRG98_022509 [Punica granatum]|uniref:AMP-dependent synthetase/ligase domain-containing protein n=1 Tax=Punica granatum TaxID=22663 RepID=A0A2I0JLD3_PUNGR|nr:hypothetical protein CRG98_022509 [Punica granatum]